MKLARIVVGNFSVIRFVKNLLCVYESLRIQGNCRKLLDKHIRGVGEVTASNRYAALKEVDRLLKDVKVCRYVSTCTSPRVAKIPPVVARSGYSIKLKGCQGESYDPLSHTCSHLQPPVDWV